MGPKTLMSFPPDLKMNPAQPILHSGRTRFRVVEVNYFEKDSASMYAIQRFNLTGDMNVIVS